MNVNRRAVLRSAAWSVPVVSVATAAPAYATSPPDDPSPECKASGWYKEPGEGQATKDYYVLVDCGAEQVHSVQIYDDVKGVWRTAAKQPDGSWAAFGFNDSRRHRKVMINGTTVLTVAFPPWRR